MPRFESEGRKIGGDVAKFLFHVPLRDFTTDCLAGAKQYKYIIDKY